MLGFELRHEVQRNIAQGIIRRQLLCDEHRSSGYIAAFDLFPAHAQKVVVRSALGLVDAALVATLHQREVRKSSRRAGADDKYGVGLGGNDPKHLRNDAWIIDAKPLHRRQLEAVGLRQLLDRLQEAVAVCVGQSHDAESFHPGLPHVIEDQVRGHHFGGGQLERPLAVRIQRLDDGATARQRDRRYSPFSDQGKNCKRIRRVAGPDDDVDVAFLDQTARSAGGGGRVRIVVEHGDLHRLTGQLVAPKAYGIIGGRPQRGSGPGQ